jgi:hypothetical protein
MKLKWEDIKPFIAKAAPVVGTLVGGPAGPAVGALIASALGTEATPDAVMEKLKSDPDALLKIEKMERDERAHIREMELHTLQSELSDMQSARDVHRSHWMPSVITLILAIMVMALGVALVFTVIPGENKDMAVYLLGQITGTFTTAVAYWIGTSRSSHEKDKRLLQ